MAGWRIHASRDRYLVQFGRRGDYATQCDPVQGDEGGRQAVKMASSDSGSWARSSCRSTLTFCSGPELANPSQIMQKLEERTAKFILKSLREKAESAS